MHNRPILYEMEFEKIDEIKSHLSSSTIDILDTIEKWIEGEKQPRCKTVDDKGFIYLHCVYEDGKCLKCGRLLGDKGDATLTLVQDFIKQTKEEIKSKNLNYQ